MWRERLKVLLARLARWIASVMLGRVVLPFWLTIAMAIFLGVPEWSEAVRFWLETAKTTGGIAATVAPILTYPYFPPGLAIFGFLYLAVVGYTGTDVVRHKLVPIVGWIVVGVCFVSIVAVAGAGYFEIRVRQEANKIALGIPRNTPDFNNPQRPQTPLFSQTNGRVLTPDQIRVLILELSKLRGTMQVLHVAYTPSDDEVSGVRVQYADILRRAGLGMSQLVQTPLGPEDEGLIFEVRDPNNISDNARKVQEAFAVANIFPKVQRAPSDLLPQGIDFALFIAPRPILWR